MYQGDIEIRLARMEDSDAIATVMKSSFAEFEMLYTPEGFSATTPNPEAVRRRMLEGPVWVACNHEDILGTAAAVARGSTLYIRGMAVLPSARGRAIGEQLLRTIETYARASAFDDLLLSTTPFLTRAIALYERFKFRRIELGPTDLFGTPLFSMRKTLLHDDSPDAQEKPNSTTDADSRSGC
jgi:ribosomal protein S18 acetylase RimI-like enzyme